MNIILTKDIASVGVLMMVVESFTHQSKISQSCLTGLRPDNCEGPSILFTSVSYSSHSVDVDTPIIQIRINLVCSDFCLSGQVGPNMPEQNVSHNIKEPPDFL